jgi:hypothetical protein
MNNSTQTQPTAGAMRAVHTPTPWRQNGPIITAQGDMALIVANVRCQLDPISRPDAAAKTFAERDANAALIVSAVNGHAELVGMLSRLADYVQTVFENPQNFTSSLVLDARAVLARVSPVNGEAVPRHANPAK